VQEAMLCAALGFYTFRLYAMVTVRSNNEERSMATILALVLLLVFVG
jgi:hypothetical protein